MSWYNDRSNWFTSAFNIGDPSYSGMQDMVGGPISQQEMNNPGMYSDGYMQGGMGDWDSMGTWGNALQGIGGLAQAWLGFNNLELNKEKFNTSKDIWNAEREANRITTNTDIMDRQNARISSTGNNNAAGNYNSMNYTRSNSTIPKVTV